MRSVDSHFSMKFRFLQLLFKEYKLKSTLKLLRYRDLLSSDNVVSYDRAKNMFPLYQVQTSNSLPRMTSSEGRLNRTKRMQSTTE